MTNDKGQAEYEPLYFNCTPARLEDELVKELLSKKKYVELAKRLIYRINIVDTLPIFEISERDIHRGLVNELERLGEGMYALITEAVRRVYQSIDGDYFFVSGIYGKVKWRFTD